MKKRILFLIIPVLLLFVFLISMTLQYKEMTFRQKIMKAIYPVMAKITRLTGVNSKIEEPPLPVEPPESFYGLTLQLNDGRQLSLAELKGKTVLVVNTASDCGYTGQYGHLQTLQEQYPDRLVVIGFPANDFKEQEKGDDASIATFCSLNYGVRFPLAAKSSVVKGAAQHPVFRWLSEQSRNGWNDKAPVWNFTKYLIDPAGRLVGYYEPSIDPLGAEIRAALEKTD